jgi:hypothetical protein
MNLLALLTLTKIIKIELCALHSITQRLMLVSRFWRAFQTLTEQIRAYYTEAFEIDGYYKHEVNCMHMDKIEGHDGVFVFDLPVCTVKAVSDQYRVYLVPMTAPLMVGQQLQVNATHHLYNTLDDSTSRDQFLGATYHYAIDTGITGTWQETYDYCHKHYTNYRDYDISYLLSMSNRFVKSSFALSLLYVAKLYFALAQQYRCFNKIDLPRCLKNLVKCFNEKSFYSLSSMPKTYSYLYF